MAEQIHHNVVNGPESAGAAAPADVAANQTVTMSATGNSQTTTSISPASLAISPDGKVPTTPFNADSASKAADPSAGNVAIAATGSVAEDHVGGPVNMSENGRGVAGSASEIGGGLNADDGSNADLSIDHSANSDTDASRADASEQARDGAGHLRASSVKKAPTFSKVSVTKTFLAKATTPQPVPAKLGEKALGTSASPQPLVKPRLVAKTVGSLQNSQKAGLNANGASGPDASKVWNKNRPVAPTPTKQLTDEQLKQQYGIHLATRLQTTEGGKDSTWADIDDDDDDWAPDSVVWVDGTKSTLNPADMPAAPVPPPKASTSVQPVKATELVRPALVARRAVETGPPKTILKPGIAAQQAKQQIGNSSQGDKPVLKAKSPAPAPSKSPWAPIPAVEAVSPLNPPVQQISTPTPAVSMQPLPSQDARAYDPMPPPQPAREIAADTFERSSLGVRPDGGSRELFNSSNGRYEPAPERRSSLRSERKPSVLSRPPHGGSAMADLSRNNGPANEPWSRRRGSSISQGSSIPAARRTSIHQRPESTASMERNSSVGTEEVSVAESARPTFSQQSAWESQMPQRAKTSEDEPAAEDPVKVQERIMREKREMAIRRRKEQEEHEEAERKERLRAKLSALEGAGKSRKEREAEAAEEKVEPVVADKAAASSDATRAAEPLSAPSAKDAVETPATAPQPQTTVPEIARSEKLPSPVAAKTQPIVLPERAPVTAEPAQPQAGRPHVPSSTGARPGFVQSQPPYKAPTSAYSSPGDRKSQSFGRSPLANNDTFSNWGPAPSNGNIWGSSGMGNGTFEKSSAFAPMPLQHSSILPPPIGMSLPGSARISPESANQEGRASSMPQNSNSEPLRNFPPPGIDSRPESSWGASRASGPAQAGGAGRLPHGPGPIAPPSRNPAAQLQQTASANPRGAGVAAWNRAAESLPYQYKADAKVAEQRQPDAVPSPQTAIKETFKRTTRDPAGALGGRRRYESTEFSVHDPKVANASSGHVSGPPGVPTQSASAFSASSTMDDVVRQAHEMATLAPIGPPHRAVLSPSPANVNFPAAPLAPILHGKDHLQPPPETISHPVNQTNSVRPKVKLPPPPPVVKLPPSLGTQQAGPQSGGTSQRQYNAWGPPGASRPIAQTPDWQARFNGLFNRTPIHTEVPPSPPRTPPKAQGAALAVSSSSKAFLDDAAKLPAATVSLPPVQAEIAPTLGQGSIQDVTTKPPIEPTFNEELSFGSLPKVRLPRSAVYGGHIFIDAPHNLLRTSANSRIGKVIQVQTIPGELYFYKAPAGYYLRLPGTKLNNILVKHAYQTGRSSSYGDRKASGKLHRGKGRDGTEQESNSPGATVNTANAATSTPATPTTIRGENAKRKSNWGKPAKTRSPVVKT